MSCIVLCKENIVSIIVDSAFFLCMINCYFPIEPKQKFHSESTYLKKSFVRHCRSTCATCELIKFISLLTVKKTKQNSEVTGLGFFNEIMMRSVEKMQ